MDKKEIFGEGIAANLKIGDIVEWSKWNSEDLEWERFYGVLIEMTNDFASQIIERNDRRANKSTEDFVNNKLLAESLGVTIEDLERWEVAY